MNPHKRNTLTGILLSVTLLTNAQTVNTTGTLRPVTAGNATGTYVSGHSISEADLKSKEVSKEISMPKNAEIYIENSSRGMVIKTWDQQKVKVSTTVSFEGESKLTDDEWLERVNLSLKTLGSSVKIKSGGVSSSLYSYNGAMLSGTSPSGDVSLYNSWGQNMGAKNNIKMIVTITVPTGSKLDIESRYAGVQLPANTGDINVDISNGSLEGDNINKLILRSKYSNINIGDVKLAEIEFTNGRFSARNIDDLDIDSKYSTIEMASAKKVVLRSTNDEYELEEAGEVRGRKNYGNLRITKLNGLLDVEGVNADVKIRNIAPAVSLIKIDDRYADIRIPLKNTKDYSIDFTGQYSSVYGNFEKKAVLPTLSNLTVTGNVNPGLTVNEAITDKNNNIVIGTTGNAITSVGTLTNLTVTGTITPAQPNQINTGRGTLIATSVVPFTGYLSSASPGMPANGFSGGTFFPNNRYNSYTMGNDTPSKFTASVGDGKGLKIDIRCQNCTVDFK